MAVRRQIYFHESDDRMLNERSHATGVSVSELVRRAIQNCYGGGRNLSWEEVFEHRVRVGTARDDELTSDALFDSEDVAETFDASGDRESAR